ncbi:hypothetical protein jhhlp_000010 [Lomentospora prolificans]|uniref:RCC1-like domain-containing protein n=1 Tax=Lomentospora prolificans TaxID=41688 RepID=A0A2N3NLE6_9PEZI|nr:hypothetical protein jhhlp_000010 [Lomentospora prolificans]
MAAIFVIGSNGSGQLGIGHQEDVSVPKQAILHPEPESSAITKIAAGGNHTLILFKSGELYWSGDASTGACGLTSDINLEQKVFRLARLTSDPSALRQTSIVSVAATWEASFILTRDTDGKTAVYAFGSGPKGELGLGDLPAEILRTPSATLIPNFPPAGTQVKDLASSVGHVIALLDNGDVYGWGNGRKGQLGEPCGFVKAPRKVDGLSFPVSKAVCGREFTCLVGEPDTGEILVLGSDKWEVRSKAPASVRGWRDVGAGWGNINVLFDSGILLNWGRNDHGQLVPPNLPKVSKLAVGSEHVVCLSEKGEVLTWGWGEHGNCGPSAEIDIKGKWNVIASTKFIPKEVHITGVGAGCATSWVIITPR